MVYQCLTIYATESHWIKTWAFYKPKFIIILNVGTNLKLINPLSPHQHPIPLREKNVFEVSAQLKSQASFVYIRQRHFYLSSKLPTRIKKTTKTETKKQQKTKQNKNTHTKKTKKTKKTNKQKNNNKKKTTTKKKKKKKKKKKHALWP